MHLHLHVPTTLVLLALGVGESKGDSLYDLARRDCPVGSPGIPQYLRCVTECRVAVAAGGGEDEDAQRRCVGEKCSHICKDPEHLKQQQGMEKEKEKEEDERDL